MNDVAIIGVGLHPFGRFGDKPAVEMAADAIHLALKDAGLSWPDIQFGVGGAHEISNTDSVTRLVGLTGILHIGGARTALYNWLYARHHGGTFLLRVEDTDADRSTAASMQIILDGLKWRRS